MESYPKQDSSFNKYCLRDNHPVTRNQDGDPVVPIRFCYSPPRYLSHRQPDAQQNDGEPDCPRRVHWTDQRAEQAELI